MRRLETQVLVAGGGGAGLAASVMLADLGVQALTVERRPDTSPLPKAHILNPRTMEILATHRLADDVYELGTPEENFQATSWYTSLGGDDPGSARMFFRTAAWGGGADRARYAAASARRSGNLPQRQLEPLLRRHATARAPGSVLFGHELVELEQDEDGVDAVLVARGSGETVEVHADYLIAADGGRTVGPALGVSMDGPEPFVYMVSILIRADLSEHLQDDDAVVRLIARPTDEGGWIRGGLVCMGPTRWDRHAEEWRISVTLPLGDVHLESYGEERAAADVRRQLGLPDLELEVLLISPWLLESVLAERFRAGRTFLVGDAAHRHSPMGGLGLNTAIQDVHNLTWKLAAVLDGHAASELLDSYEAERRPVARRNVEWATLNFFNHLNASAGFGLLPGAPAAHTRATIAALFADSADGEARRARLREYYRTARSEFEELDVELGFSYAGSPCVVADGSPAPARDPTGREYRPTARPGHRVPHAWLWRDGRRISTHELLRPGAFLLLTDADGAGWCAAAAALTSSLDPPIDAHRIGDRFEDRDGAWASLCGHGPGGAVLVRPDGHVGFRARAAMSDPDAELGRAYRVLLGRAANHASCSDVPALPYGTNSDHEVERCQASS